MWYLTSDMFIFTVVHLLLLIRMLFFSIIFVYIQDFELLYRHSACCTFTRIQKSRMNINTHEIILPIFCRILTKNRNFTDRCINLFSCYDFFMIVCIVHACSKFWNMLIYLLLKYFLLNIGSEEFLSSLLVVCIWGWL